MTIDPALFTMIAILVFVSGLIIGYTEGWDHGMRATMTEVCRLIARTTGERP